MDVPVTFSGGTEGVGYNTLSIHIFAVLFDKVES